MARSSPLPINAIVTFLWTISPDSLTDLRESKANSRVNDNSSRFHSVRHHLRQIQWSSQSTMSISVYLSPNASKYWTKQNILLSFLFFFVFMTAFVGKGRKGWNSSLVTISFWPSPWKYVNSLRKTSLTSRVEYMLSFLKANTALVLALRKCYCLTACNKNCSVMCSKISTGPALLFHRNF